MKTLQRKVCNYFIIEDDTETKARIKQSLNSGAFFCVGTSMVSMAPEEKIKLCDKTPNIVILGVNPNTKEIASNILSSFPEISIILAVKKGEDINADLLGGNRINYIMV